MNIFEREKFKLLTDASIALIGLSQGLPKGLQMFIDNNISDAFRFSPGLGGKPITIDSSRELSAMGTKYDYVACANVMNNLYGADLGDNNYYNNTGENTHGQLNDEIFLSIANITRKDGFHIQLNSYGSGNSYNASINKELLKTACVKPVYIAEVERYQPRYDEMKERFPEEVYKIMTSGLLKQPFIVHYQTQNVHLTEKDLTQLRNSTDNYKKGEQLTDSVYIDKPGRFID